MDESDDPEYTITRKRTDTERKAFMEVLRTLKACNIEFGNLPGLASVIIDNLIKQNIDLLPSTNLTQTSGE